MKWKNNEIVVFDLELDIMNSLADKHGLDELSRDIAASDFRHRVAEIARTARIEEMTLPKAIPSNFTPRKRSELD